MHLGERRTHIVEVERSRKIPTRCRWHTQALCAVDVDYDKLYRERVSVCGTR